MLLGKLAFPGVLAAIFTGAFWPSHAIAILWVAVASALAMAGLFGAIVFHQRKRVVRHLSAMPPRVSLKEFDHTPSRPANSYDLESVRLHWAEHSSSKSEK